MGTKTQEFNKSTNTVTAAAWASGGALNTARDEGASSQNGLQTAALYFGGYSANPASNATEQYDGSSWTSKNNLNTARYSGAGAGTTTAALYSGGFANPSTLQSAVEEWMALTGQLNQTHYQLLELIVVVADYKQQQWFLVVLLLSRNFN